MIVSLSLGIILLSFILLFFSPKEDKNRKWYVRLGIFGVLSPVTFLFLSLVFFATIGSSKTRLNYWLSDRLYMVWFQTVGKPSFHEVRNQNNEVKEVFDQRDVVSAREFQIEVLKTGYDETGIFKKDIDEFLSNEGINKGKTSFVAKYCFAEFKITNLITRSYRVDGRSISATKVEDENDRNFDHITFYPSTSRNTKDMNHAGDWKTGVVAFDCERANSSKYLISFASCSLRGGCGDENENDCIGNPSCPYKSYEEYIRDIKFIVLI
jgi:hypothetical protein